MKTHRQTRRSWRLASAIATLMIGSGAMQASASQDEVHVSKERTDSALSAPQSRRGAETRSVTVNFADLDLSKPAGAKTLYVRLESAARKVCSPAVQRDLAAHRDWRNCFADALDNAVAETGAVAVAGWHRDHTGRSVSAGVAVAH